VSEFGDRGLTDSGLGDQVLFLHITVNEQLPKLFLTNNHCVTSGKMFLFIIAQNHCKYNDFTQISKLCYGCLPFFAAYKVSDAFTYTFWII